MIASSAPAAGFFTQEIDFDADGMPEFRLVAGYPFASFIEPGLIEDIVPATDSPELDPWRSRNAYDRLM